MRPDLFWIGGMWVFPVMFFVMILVIGCVIRVAVRGGNSKKKESPLDILKTRYAKGEIDRSEFEQMKRDLLD